MTEKPRQRSQTKPRKSQIQVIARAMAVMRAVENEPEGLSLGALSRRLDLPRSTIQRIVGALQAENLLIAASPTARVKLGPALLRLAASVETSAAKIAKPLMMDLARDLGETIDLSVMGRDHAVFMDQVIGSDRLYGISAVAERFPLYCTANGKAMLAQLGDAHIEQRLGRAYPIRTGHTLTTLAELCANLRAVRRTGVAFDREEHTLGVCAVGVAFSDALGNRLALSVPVSTTRFMRKKNQIVERLQEIKAQLEAHYQLD